MSIQRSIYLCNHGGESTGQASAGNSPAPPRLVRKHTEKIMAACYTLHAVAGLDPAETPAASPLSGWDDLGAGPRAGPFP